MPIRRKKKSKAIKTLRTLKMGTPFAGSPESQQVWVCRSQLNFSTI